MMRAKSPLNATPNITCYLSPLTMAIHIAILLMFVIIATTLLIVPFNHIPDSPIHMNHDIATQEIPSPNTEDNLIEKMSLEQVSSKKLEHAINKLPFLTIRDNPSDVDESYTEQKNPQNDHIVNIKTTDYQPNNDSPGDHDYYSIPVVDKNDEIIPLQVIDTVDDAIHSETIVYHSTKITNLENEPNIREFGLNNEEMNNLQYHYHNQIAPTDKDNIKIWAFDNGANNDELNHAITIQNLTYTNIATIIIRISLIFIIIVSSLLATYHWKKVFFD